ADSVDATGDDIRAGLTGRIRVGLSGGPGWSGTDVLLRGFAIQRPEVEVTLVQAPGGALVRDMRDGLIDALIAPSAFASPEMRSSVLGYERWMALTGPTHRLSGDGPLPWQALDGQTIAVSGHRDDRPY